MQEQPFPPCHECGGTRFFVRRSNVAIPVTVWNGATFYACVCLACGYTTLRPYPDDLNRLRKAAEKGNAIQF